jgi:DNA-directed RNA polymerase specialized sigma24 family protein
MKKIVLLKFQGATNGEVASELGCTQRTVERKLERIRRIWVEAGLHVGD